MTLELEFSPEVLVKKGFFFKRQLILISVCGYEQEPSEVGQVPMAEHLF